MFPICAHGGSLAGHYSQCQRQGPPKSQNVEMAASQGHEFAGTAGFSVGKAGLPEARRSSQWRSMGL